MAFGVLLSPQAIEDLQGLDAHVKAEVRDQIALHLTHEPMKVSRSRIKRLRGLAQPQYRLRVGEIRVFYDVVGDEVHVLTIVSKEQAQQWLSESGILG
jgi:mRNA-degrading endonuclease RelE of RelBE toxin-antitoxin system